MAVFLVVLGLQIAGGEEACGCFGAALTITPEVMLAIDGALSLLLSGPGAWALGPWLGRRGPRRLDGPPDSR